MHPALGPEECTRFWQQLFSFVSYRNPSADRFNILTARGLLEFIPFIVP